MTQITHLKLARYLQLLRELPRPMHWDVDPSSVCDHRCRGCPYIFDGLIDPMLGVARPETAKDKRTFLDFDHFGRFVFEARMNGCQAITFVGGGEPTLHPQFTEMMQLVHTAGIKFGLVSHFGGKYNIAFFKALKHATWVRVSLNAATRQMYFKHQGRDHYDNVIRNIREALKRGIKVGASFLITSDNYDEIALAAKTLSDMGVAYIQYKPLIETPNLGKSYEGIEAAICEELARAKAETHGLGFQVLDQWDGRLGELQRHERGEFSGPCHIVRWNPKLGANGVVYSCCELAYSDEAALGSIYEEPLAAILEDADHKRKDQARCPHCWVKPVNTLINEGRLSEVQPPPASDDQAFL